MRWGVKQNILPCIVMFSLIAGFLSADIYRFAGPRVGGDNNWFDGTNWQNHTTEEKGWSVSGGLPLPGPDDDVRFNYGGATGVLNADAGVVGRLQIGLDDTGGALMFNSGAKLIVSLDDNVVGKGSAGRLIVNGGHLSYGGDLNISSNGVFELNDGLVRVDSVFYHHRDERSGGARTTIKGGVLDVNTMELNAGVLNITGGIVRIRFGSKAEIKQWISDGSMTFHGVSGGFENIHYKLTSWGDKGFEIVVIEVPSMVG